MTPQHQPQSSSLQQIQILLPKSWLGVSYKQWIELRDLEAEILDSQTELFLEQCAVLLDTDSLDPLLQDLDIDDVFTIMESLRWLTTTPKPGFQKTIGEYICRSLNELSLGEFIDVEHWIGQGYTAAPRIAAILYKRHRLDSWGNLEWEPYGYDLDTRELDFESMSVPAVWGMFEEYRIWKADFMEKYSVLFEDNTVEPDGFKEESIAPEDRKEALKEAAIAAAHKQWSWEHTIFNLTNGDVSRFDAVFSTNVILVFNVLGMRKILDV